LIIFYIHREVVVLVKKTWSQAELDTLSIKKALVIACPRKDDKPSVPTPLVQHRSVMLVRFFYGLIMLSLEFTRFF
jgi:hypothetical protein